MELVFWISMMLLVYVYIGYPLFVWAIARIVPKPVMSPEAIDASPSVTVVIAAHNEAGHIEETVRNKLASEYPADLLNVIVVSDDSSDGTDEIVAGLGERVRLERQTPRAGKTSALNMAVSLTEAEIVVFSDANSLYAPNAISELVVRFADPNVGYVTGKMVYVGTDGSVAGDGCTAYMRYENFIRAQESRVGRVIGVDGGVDAVRRSEYTAMRPDQQPDFVLPLSVLEKRLKVLYAPEALLKEQALDDTGSEYRMRVRVSLRALWALWDKRALFNPLRYPGTALQLFSHKVLRYFAFVPLALALVANIALATGSEFYAMLLFGHIGFYALAAAGTWLHMVPRGVFVTLPAYFVLINAAAAHAAIKMASGERMATWTPRTG